MENEKKSDIKKSLINKLIINENIKYCEAACLINKISNADMLEAFKIYSLKGFVDLINFIKYADKHKIGKNIDNEINKQFLKIEKFINDIALTTHLSTEEASFLVGRINPDHIDNAINYFKNHSIYELQLYIDGAVLAEGYNEKK